jgi:hypothetical protein
MNTENGERKGNESTFIVVLHSVSVFVCGAPCLSVNDFFSC